MYPRLCKSGALGEGDFGGLAMILFWGFFAHFYPISSKYETYAYSEYLSTFALIHTFVVSRRGQSPSLFLLTVSFALSSLFYI